MLQKAKSNYAASLKNLELISESIHKRRGDLAPPPPGIRGNPVGAESTEEPSSISSTKPFNKPAASSGITSSSTNILNDYNTVLDNCELNSIDSHSLAPSDSGEQPSSINSEQSQNIDPIDSENDVDALRMKIKTLAVRPIESADGKQEQEVWENELNATVDKLDHLMLMQECTAKKYLQQQQQLPSSLPESPVVKSAASSTILSNNKNGSTSTLPKQKLKKIDPLPLSNVSLHLIPFTTGSQQRFTDIGLPTSSSSCDNLSMDKKRKLSLQ